MSDDYVWQGFPGEAEMVRAKRAAAAKANSPGSGQTPATPSDPSMNLGQESSGQATATESTRSTNCGQADSAQVPPASSGPAETLVAARRDSISSAPRKPQE